MASQSPTQQEQENRLETFYYQPILRFYYLLSVAEDADRGTSSPLELLNPIMEHMARPFGSFNQIDQGKFPGLWCLGNSPHRMARATLSLQWSVILRLLKARLPWRPKVTSLQAQNVLITIDDWTLRLRELNQPELALRAKSNIHMQNWAQAYQRMFGQSIEELMNPNGLRPNGPVIERFGSSHGSGSSGGPNLQQILIPVGGLEFAQNLRGTKRKTSELALPTILETVEDPHEFKKIKTEREDTPLHFGTDSGSSFGSISHTGVPSTTAVEAQTLLATQREIILKLDALLEKVAEETEARKQVQHELFERLNAIESQVRDIQAQSKSRMEREHTDKAPDLCSGPVDRD